MTLRRAGYSLSVYAPESLRLIEPPSCSHRTAPVATDLRNARRDGLDDRTVRAEGSAGGARIRTVRYRQLLNDSGRNRSSNRSRSRASIDRATPPGYGLAAATSFNSALATAP